VIGKRAREALYVHRSAWPALPLGHRVLITKAAAAARHHTATLAKIRHDGRGVSLLDYPEFDHDPHPALAKAYTVDLRDGSVRVSDYGSSENPPILHRKEELVASTHPRYAAWSAQTLAEEECGLYPAGMLSRIGFRKVWEPMWKKARPCLKRLGR
jgi:DNA phosphorothioation-associated putative methyltransferase